MARDDSPAVHRSEIAGTWYPGSTRELRRNVVGYLDAAPVVTLPGPLLALIAPHAGYAYSGPTAGRAFAQVRGAPYTRVILCGPLHRPIRGAELGPFMIPGENAYRTPLGDVPVDRAFVEELGTRVSLSPVRGDVEHSLEIELPFLQVALERFSIVPIMFGEHIADRGAARRAETLAVALAETMDDETLVVVSTDLSHLDDYDSVVRTDRITAEYITRLDVDGLTRALSFGEAQACGATGMIAALRTAQLRGAHGAVVLGQTTSGDVTGVKVPGQYTVGYIAAAVHG